MATEAENIRVRLEQIAAELVTLGGLGPKPDYSENGRSISWTAYKASLLAEQKQLREQLVMASGPWTINEYR